MILRNQPPALLTHAAKRFSSDARSNRERGLIAAPFSRDDRSLVRPREASFDAEQFDLKDQSRIGWNYAAGAALAVAQSGRNDQLSFAADLHGRNTFIPTGNHAPLTDREFERLTAINGAIELLALLSIDIKPAGIVHDAGLAAFGGRAAADLDVFDL